ncbi:MAG: hypothetical protein M1821_001976 [Bathelium mastoideum]|nr:MAG: hypothetical protein M1821_001976 [Bathelium mastoideum]
MVTKSSTFSQIFVAALAASAGAAPSPQGNDSSSPIPNTPAGTVPQSQCVSKGSKMFVEWAVYTVNSTMSSGSGGWAGGLWDNINRVPCRPGDWQCQIDNKGGVGCTFHTSDFCNGNQVSNAIHAASNQWVYCQGDTLTDLFDDTGKVYSGMEQWLGNAAQLLSAFAKP